MWKIEIAFNFIYTLHYNGLMIYLHFNMVYELNYQLLAC
jgi:hypothetical protein